MEWYHWLLVWLFVVIVLAVVLYVVMPEGDTGEDL